MHDKLLAFGERVLDARAADVDTEGAVFRDYVHEHADDLPEGVSVETSDGRVTEGTGRNLSAVPDPDDDDYDDVERSVLCCPVCPRFETVGDDPDASLADLAEHVMPHGYDSDDALAAIHADERNTDRV